KVNPHLLTVYQNQFNVVASWFKRFQQLSAGGQSAADLEPTANDLMRQAITETERARLLYFLSVSDLYNGIFASDEQIAAYADSPRLMLIQSTASLDAYNNPQWTFEVDLLNDNLRAVVAPGQSTAIRTAFQIEHGFLDSGLEA